MPKHRKHRPTSFPQEMLRLIEAVVDRRKTLRIPLSTNSKAHALRWEFYDLRSALMRARKDPQYTEDEQLRYGELWHKAEQIIFSVPTNPEESHYLVMKHKSHSTSAQAMQSVLSDIEHQKVSEPKEINDNHEFPPDDYMESLVDQFLHK